jgi:hypothetical protein
MIRLRAIVVLLAILHAATAGAAEKLLYPFCASYDCGLIDQSGNWVVKPIYSKLRASGPYWVASRPSGVVGLLDASGKVLIPPSFVEIGQFANGLAPAKGTRNDLYGYIDPDGKWVIEPKYFAAGPFADGIAEVDHDPADGGHLVAEFIDTHGKRVIQKKFFVNGNSISQVNGLFLVEVPGKGDETRSALIDRRGNYVVPPRNDQYIQLGEDGSIVVRRGLSASLVDTSGKVLLQVSGEEAIIRTAGDGLASFEQPGKGLGLVNARSGRIIVPPRRNWVMIGDFSEGLASLRVLVGKDDVRDGYINRDGLVVIEPRFRSVSRFHGGVASVSESSGKEGLIDMAGNWVRPPADGQRFMPMADDEIASAPHLSQVQTAHGPDSTYMPAAYPPEEVDRLRPSEMRLTSEYLVKGVRLASEHHHPCGVEIAANAKGERIWPENLMGKCAAEQLARILNYDEGLLTPVARAAYLEEKRRVAREDAQRNHEWQMRDKYTGSIDDLMTQRLYPAKAERDKRLRKLIEEAGWLHGEAEVALHGAARIRLPAGIKLLLPDKVAELKEKIRAERAVTLPPPPGYLLLQEKLKAGSVSPEEFAKQEKKWKALFPDAFATPPAGQKQNRKTTPEIAVPMAMLAEEDDRWQAAVHIFEGGHLPLEAGSLPSNDELLETLKTYGFWRNSGGLGTSVVGYSSYEWVSSPQLEREPRILSWAFKYSDLYSGKSLEEGHRHGVLGGILLSGRNSIVQLSAEWGGAFSDSLATTYFPEIVGVAKRIEFLPGQGYGDVQKEDTVLAVPVARLITGAPPESLERFQEGGRNAIQRDENEKREKLTGLGFEALMYLLAGAFTLFGGVASRRKKTVDVARQTFGDGGVPPPPPRRRR